MVTITPHPQTHLKHYKILSKKGVLTVHRSVVNVIQSRGVKMAPRVVKIDDPRIDSPRLIFTHEPRCGSKEINSFAREGNSSCARAQFEPTNLITLSKVRDLIYRLARLEIENDVDSTTANCSTVDHSIRDFIELIERLFNSR